MTSPHPARAAAKTLIMMANERGLRMTSGVVQKLLYFSHGLMLARHGRPLVQEAFQAWKNGPLLEELFYSLKIYSVNPLQATAGFFPVWPSLPDDAAEERQVLNTVLDEIGSMSFGQLSALSRDNSGPWNAAYVSSDREGVMSNDGIAHHFRATLLH